MSYRSPSGRQTAHGYDADHTVLYFEDIEGFSKCLTCEWRACRECRVRHGVQGEFCDVCRPPTE
ncbi:MULTISPECIES: hypothetical protein [Streptomyces]|uniref:hypothetical protein n=1 Tax=Streptomyces TaxID=1883 RepID=UPI0004BD8D69|nr:MULTISPECIES: hypothetical protein [unclassified Streptomyces]